MNKDKFGKSNNFITFLRNLNGLGYFMLYVKYSNSMYNTYNETMNYLAYEHKNEKDVRNLEAYWEAFESGVTDPNDVVLPYEKKPELLEEFKKVEYYCDCIRCKQSKAELEESNEDEVEKVKDLVGESDFSSEEFVDINAEKKAVTDLE